MKKYKKNGTVFTLLASNYFFLTLILTLIMMVAFILLCFQIVKAVEPLDKTKVNIYTDFLNKREYEAFPIEKFLGDRGEIIVVNESGKIIYQSDEEKVSEELSLAEIEYIPTYYPVQNIESSTYKNKMGTTIISVKIKQEEDDLSQKVVKEYILDESYQILFDSSFGERKQLTTREFQLLTQTYNETYKIYKYAFITEYNEKNILLIFVPRRLDKTILKGVFGAIINSIILFIICYLVLIVISMGVLKRKIRKPLFLLLENLNSLQEGTRKKISYKGPQEFVNIIDSFNRLSEKLDESEKQRQTLIDEKQKMLADISHDLKTPITVIKGYTKALCDGIVKEEDKAVYLNIIYDKSNLLNSLINTFYEYNKLEHPDFMLNFEELDLCEYFRSYVAGKYAEIDLSGFNVVVDIPEVLMTYNFDQKQLKRAFDNIVNNSLKYCEKGTSLFFGINVNGCYIEIILGDNGDGIPPEITKTIFEPFVVGEISRCSYSSGLGLSIAKEIVIKHGGSIELIEPQKDYNTVFSIRFPLSPNGEL